MDNTRTVTDAKQQKIKIKKDVITSSMSTIVDRTCYVFFSYSNVDREILQNDALNNDTQNSASNCSKMVVNTEDAHQHVGIQP
jgi:hypothetical protein